MTAMIYVVRKETVKRFRFAIVLLIPPQRNNNISFKIRIRNF